MSEQIAIVVTENGSVTVKRNLTDIGVAANSAAKEVNYLQDALAALSLGALVAEIGKLADEANNLTNRLKVTGLEGANLNYIWQELLQTSNETRSGFAGSVEMYSRMYLSTRSLGLSQMDLIDSTRILNEALLIGGANTQEAHAGFIQLSQALAQGVLRGQDLRSVLEFMPVIADAIAEKMGTVRGKLRELGAQGKITSQIVIQAILESGDKIDQWFQKVTPTMNQAWAVLKNSAMDAIHRWDAWSGASENVSKSLIYVAQHLDDIIKGLAAMASGIILVGGSSYLINKVTAAVVLLNEAIIANPFGALLTVLTMVVTALVLFGDQIQTTADGFITVSDWINVIKEDIAGLSDALSNSLGPTFGIVLEDIKERLSGISFQGVMESLAWFVDNGIGVFRGIVGGLVALFTGLPATLRDLMASALNGLLQSLTDFVNDAIGILNAMRAKAGFELYDLFDFTIKNTGGGFGALGEEAGNAFWKGVDSSHGAQDYIQSVADRAKGSAVSRIAQEAEASYARLQAELKAMERGKAAPPEQKDNSKEIKKVQTALDQLVKAYDSVGAAQDKYRKVDEVTQKGVQMGLITEARRNDLLWDAANKLRDAIDPIGALNRELDKEIGLLGLSNDQREIQVKLLDIEEKLRKKNVTMTPQELAQLRSKITLLKEISRDPWYGSIQGLQEYASDATNLGDQLKDAWKNAFKGMEDALVNFVQTGKFSFTDLANSIIADLIRIAVRSAVLGPLASGLGSFFSGIGGTNVSQIWNAPSTSTVTVTPLPLYHTGGVVGSDLQPTKNVALDALRGAPRFHSGGGMLDSSEYPAVLQKGELVLTQSSANAYIRLLDMLSSLGTYAYGGMGASGGGGGYGQGQPVFNIYVTTSNNQGEESSASGGPNDSGGFDIDLYIANAADKGITKLAMSNKSSLVSMLDKTRRLNRANSAY